MMLLRQVNLCVREFSIRTGCLLVVFSAIISVFLLLMWRPTCFAKVLRCWSSLECACGCVTVRLDHQVLIRTALNIYQVSCFCTMNWLPNHTPGCPRTQQAHSTPQKGLKTRMLTDSWSTTPAERTNINSTFYSSLSDLVTPCTNIKASTNILFTVNEIDKNDFCFVFLFLFSTQRNINVRKKHKTQNVFYFSYANNLV